MVEVGDLVGTQIIDGGILSAASGIITAAIIILIFVIVGVALFFLIRLWNYKIEVEIYEAKGDYPELLATDKAKRVSNKGVSYIKFLKYKDDRFQNIKFPDSNLMYKKKFFGTKLKAVLVGDDLYFDRLRFSKDEGLSVKPLPPYMREDYLTKLDSINKDYAEGRNNAMLISLAFGAGMMLLFFGLFVIWQSNVATAEATQSLAAAINSASQAGVSVPQAP